MELRQLKYFVAVAEEANFTRAAQRMQVAQPGVSAQIARLERELGQPLLDRSRRSVRLTAAGEAVLPHARAALAAAANVSRTVGELTQLVRGTLTIGTVLSHNIDMPVLLADFHADHPDDENTVKTDDSDALVERVRCGTLDAAVVSIGPDECPEGLDVFVVNDEAFVAAVCRDDALAGRNAITLAGLVGRPLIALPVGTGIRRRLDMACAQARVTPRIAFEASTPQALVELAERGLGVAIVPRSAAQGRDRLCALPIVPELRGRLVLAWRSVGPMSPAARVLVDKARRLLSA
jgi:DNA-binding transcriptional LysR family regulator